MRHPRKTPDPLPPPKRRTTPLGGTLGAQWTDSITHVPSVVPPLPDHFSMHAAGSYGDLVAHATCSQKEELLPPLCLISALPELVGTGSGTQVAFRNPIFAKHTMHMKSRCNNSHASYISSSRSANKVRPPPKGHQLNSARRDAQAIASLLGETPSRMGAHVMSHPPLKVPIVGGSTQVASVKPGAAQGDCKSLVASPG